MPVQSLPNTHILSERHTNLLVLRNAEQKIITLAGHLKLQKHNKKHKNMKM